MHKYLASINTILLLEKDLNKTKYSIQSFLVNINCLFFSVNMNISFSE